MKMHTIYLLIIAVLITALGWTCTVYEERAAAWEFKEQSLQADLAATLENATRWHLTATALQGQTHAQSALAEACLEREAAAPNDAMQREAILLLGPPAPLPSVLHPDLPSGLPPAVPPNLPSAHKDKGVSHATRRAAADYLNRGL